MEVSYENDNNCNAYSGDNPFGLFPGHKHGK
jgi:hypothetical protein